MDKILSIIAIITLIVSCKGQDHKEVKKQKSFKVVKTENEWRQQLTEMQFYVLRQAGTERPFTGAYYNHHGEGTYVCAACKHPLYKSEHKFNSGTGWPSFDRAVEGSIYTDVDYKLGYGRNELLCNNCGGHLGHVFNDGPKQTTGKRHCINSVSLNFVPIKK